MEKQATEYRGLVITIETSDDYQEFFDIYGQKGNDKFYTVRTKKEMVITNNAAIVKVTSYWQHGELIQSEPFTEAQWATWDAEDG